MGTLEASPFCGSYQVRMLLTSLTVGYMRGALLLASALSAFAHHTPAIYAACCCRVAQNHTSIHIMNDLRVRCWDWEFPLAHSMTCLISERAQAVYS